ncbi:MAG: hypothetical protein LBU62_08325, partial [Bacteroidales bacterium]|nr:hypothetical protein [Bacteroidales bacterium]
PPNCAFSGNTNTIASIKNKILFMESYLKHLQSTHYALSQAKYHVCKIVIFFQKINKNFIGIFFSYFHKLVDSNHAITLGRRKSTIESPPYHY